MFEINKNISKIIFSTLFLSAIGKIALASESHPTDHSFSPRSEVQWKGFLNHPKLHEVLLFVDDIKDIQNGLRQQTGFSVHGNPQLNVFQYLSSPELAYIPNLNNLPDSLEQRGLIETTWSKIQKTKKLQIFIYGLREGHPLQHLRPTIISFLNYIEDKGLLPNPVAYYLEDMNKNNRTLLEITAPSKIHQVVQIVMYFDRVPQEVLEDILRYSKEIYNTATLFRDEKEEDGLLSPLIFTYDTNPTLQFNLRVDKLDGQRTLNEIIEDFKHKFIIDDNTPLTTSSLHPICIKGHHKIRDALRTFYNFHIIPDQVIDYIKTYTIHDNSTLVKMD